MRKVLFLIVNFILIVQILNAGGKRRFQDNSDDEYSDSSNIKRTRINESRSSSYLDSSSFSSSSSSTSSSSKKSTAELTMSMKIQQALKIGTDEDKKIIHDILKLMENINITENINISIPERTILEGLLFATIIHDNIDALKLFLKLKISNPNLQFKQTNRYILSAKSKEAVELLLKAGVNINPKISPYETPILPYFSNQPEILETLLKNGADVTKPDSTDKSFLDYIEQPEYEIARRVYEKYLSELVKKIRKREISGSKKLF